MGIGYRKQTYVYVPHSIAPSTLNCYCWCRCYIVQISIGTSTLRGKWNLNKYVTHLSTNKILNTLRTYINTIQKILTLSISVVSFSVTWMYEVVRSSCSFWASTHLSLLIGFCINTKNRLSSGLNILVSVCFCTLHAM